MPQSPMNLGRAQEARAPRLMTLDERLHLIVKSIELEDQGKQEEAMKLRRSIPLAPYLAKFYKDYIGVDALLETGWNLTEAEAEYGYDWLTK
jgi:hypothetical protein